MPISVLELNFLQMPYSHAVSGRMPFNPWQYQRCFKWQKNVSYSVAYLESRAATPALRIDSDVHSLLISSSSAQGFALLLLYNIHTYIMKITFFINTPIKVLLLAFEKKQQLLRRNKLIHTHPEPSRKTHPPDCLKHHPIT